MTQDKAQELIDSYQSNFNCDSGYMAQRYIPKPFLVNSHKFDFRVYMFIASMDPLIILYHDGFLRIAPVPYNSTETSWKHITNLGRAKEYYKSIGFTKEQILGQTEKLGWMYESFEEYLLNSGYSVNNWIQTTFKPFVKKVALYLVNMNDGKLLKHPRVFELFGLDFLLDSDLKIWFIEANSDPGISSSTGEKQQLNRELLLGIIELEYSLEYNPRAFDEILAKTRFEWVFDGRKQGVSAFHGVISQDCFYRS